MKLLILAIAAVVAIPDFALARAQIAAKDVQDPGRALVASRPQDPGVVKLAMGPTSAPHLPGGTGNGSKASPPMHKKAKHSHKNVSRN